MLHLRKNMIAVAALVASVVIAPPVAIAATGSGGATAVEQAFPNGVPAGGTVIDNGTAVSFDGGSVILNLTPQAYTDCPAGWLCLWHDEGYLGRMLEFQSVGYWQNLTDYGFNDQMSSWRNRTSHDAEWSYDINGGGTTRCMASGASAKYVGDGDNDQASAIKIFNTNGLC